MLSWRLDSARFCTPSQEMQVPRGMALNRAGRLVPQMEADAPDES